MAAARTITVALIGHGYWGPNLLRVYSELPGVRVTWVCDRREPQLERAAARAPSARLTRDVADVLADDDVQAVLVATPISTHHELATAALQAGKHVFVEKPMTHRADLAAELVETARRVERTLMVGHTFVFSPPVRKVKELIDAGELGDIYFITTSRVNLGLHQSDVSVVWDLAPHDLSILSYWLDEAPETVSVLGRDCVGNGHPDVAFINVRYPGEVVAEVQVSWLSPVKLRRTMVVGSRKMLVYDDTEPVEKVKLFDHGVDLEQPTDFGEFQLAYRTGDIVAPRIEPTEPLRLEAEEFLGAVREGREPVSGGRFGLDVVAAVEAAERSLRDGGCEVNVSRSVAAREGRATP